RRRPVHPDSVRARILALRTVFGVAAALAKGRDRTRPGVDVGGQRHGCKGIWAERLSSGHTVARPQAAAKGGHPGVARTEKNARHARFVAVRRTKQRRLGLAYDFGLP